MAKPEMSESEPELESPLSPSNTSTPVPEYPLRSILDVRSDATASVSSSSSTSSASASSLNLSRARNLHITNIPFSWHEDDLEQLFSPFGSVLRVRIVRNERGSKGYGFVSFSDGEAAHKAIGALSGMEILGRTISVNVANNRIWPERQPERRQASQQRPSELGTLLLNQRLLATQQLQQFLITQQRTDMIASALGLPTANLGGLLAGQLPYPAAAGLLQYPGAAAMPLGLNPLALQLQSLQQRQLHTTTALLPTQQYAAYGQMPTVPAYTVPPPTVPKYTVPPPTVPKPVPPPTVPNYTVPPPPCNVAGRMPKRAALLATPINNQVPTVYITNEMAGSSSAMLKGRSTAHRNDGSSQRFNPY